MVMSAIANFKVLALLVGCASLGTHLERTSQHPGFGARWHVLRNLKSFMSAPLATYFATAILANVGLLPVSSPMYDAVHDFGMPIAVALLLLRTFTPPTTISQRSSTELQQQLRSQSRRVQSAAVCFSIGALSTILGGVVAHRLVHIPSDPPGLLGWRIAAALVASYIGGTINFVSVASALSISPSVLSVVMAADMCIMAVYMAVTFAMGGWLNVNTRGKATDGANEATANHKDQSSVVNGIEETRENSQESGVLAVAIPLLTAMCLCMTASLASPIAASAVAYLLQQTANAAQSGGGSFFFMLLTLLSIGLSALRPKFLRSTSFRSGADAISGTLMQLFFASIGAATRLSQFFARSPRVATSAHGIAIPVLVLTAVITAVHMLGTLVLGRLLLRKDPRLLLIASNANVGGAGTAAAMAASMGWQGLIPEAVGMGTAGYAVGTFLGLAVGGILRNGAP